MIVYFSVKHMAALLAASSLKANGIQCIELCWFSACDDSFKQLLFSVPQKSIGIQPFLGFRVSGGTFRRFA